MLFLFYKPRIIPISEIMILEQKNLKIGDEIDYQKKQEDKMNRNVNNLQNELLQLNDSLVKKRGSKFDLDKHNIAVQTEYINKLKVGNGC